MNFHNRAARFAKLWRHSVYTDLLACWQAARQVWNCSSVTHPAVETVSRLSRLASNTNVADEIELSSDFLSGSTVTIPARVSMLHATAVKGKFIGTHASSSAAQTAFTQQANNEPSSWTSWTTTVNAVRGCSDVTIADSQIPRITSSIPRAEQPPTPTFGLKTTSTVARSACSRATRTSVGPYTAASTDVWPWLYIADPSGCESTRCSHNIGRRHTVLASWDMLTLAM